MTQTRQIIFYGAISLDGYLADQHFGLDWLYTIPAEDILSDSLATFLKTVDTTVMGRQTFEDILQQNTELPYKEQTNYVLTSQPNLAVSNVQYVREELTSFIKQLKMQPGKNVWVVGGGKLLSSLIQAKLIDEWYIQLAPIILGAGIPLFANQSDCTKLKLLGSKQYQNFVEIHYQTLR